MKGLSASPSETPIKSGRGARGGQSVFPKEEPHARRQVGAVASSRKEKTVALQIRPPVIYLEFRQKSSKRK